MATLNPATSTHLEFTQTNQTVSIVNDADNRYVIKKVTYKHENDVKFEDMKLTWAGNSFTYSSSFDNAVDRVIHYTVEEQIKTGTSETIKEDGSIEQKDEYTYKLAEYTVNNFAMLPEEYASVFKVENPQESTNVVFTTSGAHFKREVTTDETTGATSERWYETTFGPITYTAVIETNMEKHMQLIKEYVGKGKYAKMSPTKPLDQDGPTQTPELPEGLLPS